jgi:hypothetical protein
LVFRALNKKLPDMPPLFYGTSTIKRVSEVKYLGIYMDEQLNFKWHIEKLRGKISPMVGMLYRLKFYLPYRILKSIYHAFIDSNIQGRIGSPNFGGKVKKGNRRFETVVLTKKKKGHAGGPSFVLGPPKLEGPHGIFPTPLYGQSAPGNIQYLLIVWGSAHKASLKPIQM